MEFQEFETQEDNDEEDAAIQYMIEQSLLESIKQMETLRDSTTADSRRSDFWSLECTMTSALLFLNCNFCFTPPSQKKKV